MSYNWTTEQLTIFNTIESALETGTPDFIKIEAVAGSSKSSSLIETVKRLHRSTKTNYLVFGNANAAEARKDFGVTATVSTLHSLAYHYVVKQYGLSNIRPFLTWKDIPRNIKIPFGKAFEVLQLVDAFCNTTHLSIEAFLLAENVDYILCRPIKQVFEAITQGKMPCTHSYYLKVFHNEVVNGNIPITPTDLLLVDEAGDLTPITIDIIDNYPAKVKVIVGDYAQNIFGFMDTVNAFDIYKNKGTTLLLSKSFRVTTKIAKAIEVFCKDTIDPDFVFTGMDYPVDVPIITKGIICRNNIDILRWMMVYQKRGKAFRLASAVKLKQLFDIPMAVLAAPGTKQYSADLKHIQSLIDDWGRLKQQSGKLKYILDNSENDPNIKKAVQLVIKYSPQLLIATKKYAETHKSKVTDDLILTAHTSKGMTLDHVYIDKSMNESLDDVMSKYPDYFIPNVAYPKLVNPLPKELQEAFNLYYVAVSRCRHKLDNARHIHIK